MEKPKFNKHYIGKCYINFYNKEHDFLEDLIYDLKRWLNYKDGRGGIETSEVKMYLICKGGYFFWSGFEPNPDEEYINCGDNVNMFLAIAALRDDNDYMQYFISNESKQFYKCTSNKFDFHQEGIANWLSCSSTEYFRKATVKELKEYFKNIKLQ